MSFNKTKTKITVEWLTDIGGPGIKCREWLTDTGVKCRVGLFWDFPICSATSLRVSSPDHSGHCIVGLFSEVHNCDIAIMNSPDSREKLVELFLALGCAVARDFYEPPEVQSARFPRVVSSSVWSRLARFGERVIAERKVFSAELWAGFEAERSEVGVGSIADRFQEIGDRLRVGTGDVRARRFADLRSRVALSGRRVGGVLEKVRREVVQEPIGEWSGWIAFLHDVCDDHLVGRVKLKWCVVPSDFWECERCIPDWSMDSVPNGFFECQEHTLDASCSLLEQKFMLRKLGFRIIDVPF